MENQADKCIMCDNEHNSKYESFTMSYYRNKTSGVYYFCSANCTELFNKTKKCWFCSYYGDLCDTNCGFMACTSNGYWRYSCYDKFEIRRNAGLDIMTDNYFNDYNYYDYVKKNGCEPDNFINEQFLNLYKSGNRKDAIQLIDSVNTKYDDGSVLYTLAYKGDCELMKILLEKGSNVDLIDCMNICSRYKFVDCVKLLLDHGVDPSS